MTAYQSGKVSQLNLETNPYSLRSGNSRNLYHKVWKLTDFLRCPCLSLFSVRITHMGGSLNAPTQNWKLCWQWKWNTKTKQKQVQNHTKCKCYMWKNHCNKIMSSCKGHISDLNVFIGHWMSGLTMESAGCELAVVDFDSSMNKGNSQLDLRMPSTCLSQWVQFNLQWCRNEKIVSRLIPGKNLDNPTVGTGLVPSKAHLRLLYPIQNILRDGFLQCAGNRVQQVLTQFVKTRSQHLELPQVMKGDELWNSKT